MLDKGGHMKNKFIRSTMILLIGGAITKLLGMIIKIVMTRNIGSTGMGIYMLLSPTFMLLVSLAQLGLPVAISTLIAKEEHGEKEIIFSCIPIVFLINVVLMIFLACCSKFLAFSLVHEPRCYYAFLCMGFVLPFISVTSILRGYFFGKEQMFPHVFSCIVEDVVWLFTLIIGIPYFLMKGIEYAVAFIILSNIVSELTSIIILFCFLPKHIKVKKFDFIPKWNIIKKILNISLPATGSRFIGSIGYFLEPIIMTHVLLQVGYSNHFIVDEYGILNGYVLPMLTMPSFFTMAISQALIPVISKSYGKRDYNATKKRLGLAIAVSFLIGIPITAVFIFFPSLPLQIIYQTQQGTTYLRVLAPIFLLHYIQAPLTASLQAMEQAKTAMKGTLLGMILRTCILFIFCYFKIGLWALVIALSSNIIFVTLHQARHVYRLLNRKQHA